MPSKYLNGKYPRNLIIQKPVAGGLIISVFSFVFMIIYKPLGAQPARTFSFVLTMGLYSFFSGIAAMLGSYSLKRIEWFRNDEDWTIRKEILSSLYVIGFTCIAIYFMGFIIESGAPRWNFSTFFNSVSRAFLIGVIPFLFISLTSFRYLFPHRIGFETDNAGKKDSSPEREVIISSQLKKESLSFYPSELIYAESDGNYVIFWIEKGGQLKKEIIRNSINNIEKQLSEIPFFFRTHRAFIVNLKRIVSKHGTTLGYTIRLAGAEARIPVSRNKTREFNMIFEANRS